MTRERLSDIPVARDPLLVPYAFIVLSIAIPSRLLLEPLGALGYPATIVAAGAPVLYVFARLIPSQLADGFNPVRTLLLAFGLVALIGYAVGLTKVLSVVEATASIRALINYAGFAGLGLLVVDGIRDRRHLDRLLELIVLGASLLAIYGIVQFATGLSPDSYIRIPGLVLQEVDITLARSMFTRVQGTSLHPIEFGVILALVLPIALHYAMHGTTVRPPSRWRWIPVLLILIASPMSVSRSSVLGIIVGVGLLAMTWTWRTRLKALGFAIVLALAMRAAIPGLLGTLLGMFTWFEDDPSVEGRTQDYPKVLEFFHQDPWLGRGIGTFVPAEHFFLDNEYLGTLITTGLLGLVVLIALFLVVISVGRAVRRYSTDPATRSLGQALAAAALVSMVTWVTYDGLGFRVNAGHAFVLFGAAGALWRLEVGRPRWGRGQPRSQGEATLVGDEPDTDARVPAEVSGDKR